MVPVEAEVPVDRQARHRIAHDTGRSLFVEAGAGTGKTKVLVDRVVHAIATGVVSEPGRLVAITFTAAAAAELRDRVRRGLARAAAPGRDDDERRRCETAWRHVDEAVITTLHGFAHGILAEHALAAGLSPRFEVVDEVDARVGFAARWSSFCDDLFDDPDVERAVLLGTALGLTTTRLQEVAAAFHARWDRVVGARFVPSGLPVIDLDPVLGPVEAAVAAAGTMVAADDKLADVLRSWCDGARLLRDAADAGDEPEALRVLAGLWRKPGNLGNGARWGERKAVVLGELAAAGVAVSELAARLRTAVLEQLLPRLAAFTVDGAAERERAGRLEFHDLLVRVRDLVHSDTEVRATLARRFDMILIDEFQDTDPLQLDLAFALAASDPDVPPRPWARTELRPGGLLLVGDPKQSIYGFRGADIGLWDQARRVFGDGAVERLSQSFRSVPGVIDWVNAIFGALVGEGVPGSQPRYEALAAFRPRLDEDPPVVVVGGPADGLSMAELRQREADDLARLVVTMKAGGWVVADGGDDGSCRPLRFDDIAVLLPTRLALPQLERALDHHDVPHRVESRSLVWATDAVREVLSVLAAVDDPGDEVAVVAALRCPGFACSDADLVRWRSAGGTWDYGMVEVPSSSAGPAGRDAADDHARTGPVFEGLRALAHYHRRRVAMPVDELVEEVVRERRLVELTFARRRPRDHWRRLRFVVDQARAFVERGGRCLGEFLAWAAVQADEGAQVVETPVPEADDDAVRILTIHGSKGLEFPVVMLAGLASTGVDSGARVLFDAERPEVSFGPATARWVSAGYGERSGDLGLAAHHEGLRLLYVAATRARDHLVVSVHHKAHGSSTAKELWRLCDGPAAAWCRPQGACDQLRLAASATVGFTAAPTAERDRWRDAHDAVLRSARRPRTVSATSIAAHRRPPGAGNGAVVGQPDDGVGPVDRGGLPPPVVVATSMVVEGAPLSSVATGGAAVGRAVHEVLRAVAFGRDLPSSAELASLAAFFSAGERLSPGAEAGVALRAGAALASPSVVAARQARRRWRELFVAVPIGRDGVVVEGYLDLLYEDSSGGLVIVDFKTDAAPTGLALDAAVARYRPQAAAYALALEGAVGRPADRAVFVFAREDGAIEREIGDLRSAVGEVRTMVDADDW
ncbi:MAG: UvrD-helicase domain-containing protein [Acidimicrobiia bacterium]